MKPSRPFLLKLLGISTLLAASLFIPNCSLVDPDKKEKPSTTSWDTSFPVNGVTFGPGGSPVERSQVHKGSPERLARFFQKCRGGGEVRIGFIGGSITAGASASSDSNRYSTMFCGFLEKLFPKANFVEINAGIGATDSRYGASRVKDDLLRHSPDLIVVEFAVNDDYSDSLYVKSTMEGLIRQSLAGSTPVLLLHWMNRAGIRINQRIQLQLAEHYGLPVVSYLEAIRPMVDSGSIEIDTIMADAVHPTNHGHRICAYLLYSFFKKQASALIDAGNPIPALPNHLTTNLYESAGLLGEGDNTIGLDSIAGWKKTTSELGRVEFVTGDSDARLNLHASVKELTVGYWRRKERTGVVVVNVDGSDVDTLRAEFPEDWGGGYLQLKRIFSTTEAVDHKVTFRLVRGDTLELKAFLYAGKITK